MKFILILLLALTASAVSAQEAPTLFGGAQSVRESRGAWVLLCGFDGETKACNLRQEQRENTSGKVVLVAELVPAGGELNGSLVLPFGVDLSKGASLQVDDQEVLAASFQTCVASLGCALLLRFDSAMTSAIAKGQTLKVTFTPVNGSPLTYPISLSGMSGSLARAAELLQ